MDQGGIKLRFMRPDEAHKVAELIFALQKHQKMEKLPRIPSGQEIEHELTYKDEKTGTILANKNGTYTIVAIDVKKSQNDDGGNNYDYIIGYMIYYQAFSILDGRYFYMTSFFIEQEYRLQGLGKKFMEFMRLHALATDNKRVDIPFMNNNEIGIKFYSKYGSYLVNNEYLIMGFSLLDNN